MPVGRWGVLALGPRRPAACFAAAATLLPLGLAAPPPAGGGVKDVFLLEELQLAGQEALMVVVMEYCDLGEGRLVCC